MVLKKILTMILSALVLNTSLTTIPSAEKIHPPDDEVVAPAHEIADNAISILRIDGQTALCNSKTKSKGAVEIVIVQTLEKYSGWFWIWNAVDDASWTIYNYSGSVDVTNKKSGLSSGTYRLKSEFTLKNSAGKTESFTVYSEEVKLA